MASDPQRDALPSEPPDVSPERRAHLERLAQRYYAPLLSFFRKRTRNSPDVPDLVQQVFLRLAQRGEQDEIENADGYIFRTAANTLNDHYRHSRVRERFANDPQGFGARSDSDFPTERVLEGRESLNQVVEAMRSLPERTRDVLIMRCFEGLKYAEIAELFGISVRAIEKHMAKALAHVSRALEAPVDKSRPRSTSEPEA
jgi:RNA polymerase sigma factor (sigma-70 family)